MYTIARIKFKLLHYVKYYLVFNFTRGLIQEDNDKKVLT